MTTKGIIFSAPMVRALLAGRKTQTRRLLNPQPELVTGTGKRIYADSDYKKSWTDGGSEDIRYAAGDRLYVRETWSVRMVCTDIVEVGYKASELQGHSRYVEHWPVDRAIPGKGEWPRYPKYGPCIHMPRWASRLWLEVSEVRVQRLQNISEADAIAEGCPGRLGPNPEFPDEWDPSPVEEYRDLWNSLHTEPGTTWADNPWVVAVSFAVHHGNIDAMPA